MFNMVVGGCLRYAEKVRLYLPVLRANVQWTFEPVSVQEIGAIVLKSSPHPSISCHKVHLKTNRDYLNCHIVHLKTSSLYLKTYILYLKTHILHLKSHNLYLKARNLNLKAREINIINPCKCLL